MKKLLFHMIIVTFCLLPVTASGGEGKCIEGDCINGAGVYSYPDGGKYNGEFKNGEITGNGAYTYPDGSRYTGEFANGVRHGQGTLKMVDGISYTGQWADDLPNGQGVNTLADGMQYSGEFKNGIMYGSGTLIMPDGNRLKIKWNNALPLQKEWYMTAASGNAQKLLSQEPQQHPGNVQDPPKDLITGKGTPSQKPDQPAVPPEQVAPQAAELDEVAVKDVVQTEEISKRQLPEEAKIKLETTSPAGKQDEREPQGRFPQNAETTNTVEYAHITAGANIRSQASLTSEVLRTVPPGYPVIVVEKQADWLMVEDYRGRRGWVFASLVNKPGTVIIKVFKGNLRRGPSLKDDTIVQLDHGTIMSVLERKGEWLKVSDFKELTGWLHRKVVWPEKQ